MSLDPSDKLDHASEAATAVGPTARPLRGRMRPRVWPIDTGASEDTFATPSEAPTGTIDAQSLSGPEPAVFGGVNPQSQAEQQAAEASAAAEAEAEAAAEPLGTALEEPVRGNELLGDAPLIDYGRILRSTPFLLGSMLVCLIGMTFLIREVVPTETYVETTVRFVNYGELNDLEKQDLHTEMRALLRTSPLRLQAIKLLQERSSDVRPGFLFTDSAFGGSDAVTWEPNGTLHLRRDSINPSEDITRLAAVTEVFYSQLAARGSKLEGYKSSLAAQQNLYAQNAERDAQLKIQIDGLFDDAQRYSELKEALQSTERYLDVADESNPLRLVAKQNLVRIGKQVAEAREVSLQRDDLLTERVTLQKDNELVAAEIARLERAIAVFVHPAPTDSNSLRIHDTRDRQKLITRSAWVGTILFFAGVIALIHFIDNRAAERYRRERREMLKLQSRRAEERARVPAES